MTLPSAALDRRQLLRGAALSAAAVAAARLPLGAAPTRALRRPSTPEEALERLMAGNARFVAGETRQPRRTMERVEALAGGQSPFAAILGCADSRVPPELLFDEGFGDIFTVRVAGNVATPEEIASLEYAVAVLGSKVVMVLGHSSCGAVQAAMDGGPVPGQISALYTQITPYVQGAGDDVGLAVEDNVRAQARRLRTSSPVIGGAIESGDVAVVGGVYGLEDGRVRVLEDD